MHKLSIVLLTAIVASLVASPALAADLDGDSVRDIRDNCVAVANPDQLDSDADGLGNACDFDYNNDGVVDGADQKLLEDAFGTEEASPDFDSAFDADDDGVVAGSDWAAFIRVLSPTAN